MKITKIELPYAVFGSWEVRQDGTLKSDYVTPSGRESTITIYPDRLGDPDLLLRLRAEQVVENWHDFMDAIFTAWELAKIKRIENFQTGFE
jgi:hypothetical protein